MARTRKSCLPVRLPMPGHAQVFVPADHHLGQEHTQYRTKISPRHRETGCDCWNLRRTFLLTYDPNCNNCLYSLFHESYKWGYRLGWYKVCCLIWIHGLWACVHHGQHPLRLTDWESEGLLSWFTTPLRIVWDKQLRQCNQRKIQKRTNEVIVYKKESDDMLQIREVLPERDRQPPPPSPAPKMTARTSQTTWVCVARTPSRPRQTYK